MTSLPPREVKSLGAFILVQHTTKPPNLKNVAARLHFRLLHLKLNDMTATVRRNQADSEHRIVVLNEDFYASLVLIQK